MSELKINMTPKRSIKLDRFQKGFNGNLRKGFTVAGGLLLKEMRQKVSGTGFTLNPARSSDYPGVLTGEMRRTMFMRVEDGGMTLRVGPDVKYAKYQEFGTKHIPARPFVFPTWNDTGDKAVDAIQKALMRGI